MIKSPGFTSRARMKTALGSMCRVGNNGPGRVVGVLAGCATRPLVSSELWRTADIDLVVRARVGWVALTLDSDGLTGLPPARSLRLYVGCRGCESSVITGTVVGMATGWHRGSATTGSSGIESVHALDWSLFLRPTYIAVRSTWRLLRLAHCDGVRILELLR